jgi:hypothetical protein
MLKRRLHVQTSTISEASREIHEDENREVRIDGNIRSKILSYVVKRFFFLTPMDFILIVLGELEYFEGLVKLARKKRMLKIA